MSYRREPGRTVSQARDENAGNASVRGRQDCNKNTSRDAVTSAFAAGVSLCISTDPTYLAISLVPLTNHRKM